MSLLGKAAVAMWWNVDDEHLSEFQEWHSKEHLLERLGIPGFERGSRWRQEESGRFFVIYELTTYDVLVSDAYRARLNDPTPWSTTMMPLHRDMVRSQCRVVTSHGRGVATYVSTIRLSPRGEHERDLEQYLEEALARAPERIGITGAHLLRTDTPAAPATREQRIRGADSVADWIVLLSGHDADALRSISTSEFDAWALTDSGAASVQIDEPYRLVHAMVCQDVR